MQRACLCACAGLLQGVVSTVNVSVRMCRTSSGCCPYSQRVCAHVQDFCRVLSELHDKAPVHGWEASKAAIEKAFGLPVDQMFESIDHDAIASGSIAQVTVLLPCRLHCYIVVLAQCVVTTSS